VAGCIREHNWNKDFMNTQASRYFLFPNQSYRPGPGVGAR
jgi:hypothetical protein